MYRSILEIRQANERAGFHFFEPGSMRFFASRVHSEVYGGRYFVTSEQFRPLEGKPAPRRYSVRMIRPDGSIDTLFAFQAYASRSGAHAAARRLSEVLG